MRLLCAFRSVRFLWIPLVDGVEDVPVFGLGIERRVSFKVICDDTY